LTGAGKPSDIAVSSSLFVETVEKKPGATKTKRFVGDASRVVAQGNGLKKGFSGRPSVFTLDVKDAGALAIYRTTLSGMRPHTFNKFVEVTRIQRAAYR
jgi:hypothetical protein